LAHSVSATTHEPWSRLMNRLYSAKGRDNDDNDVASSCYVMKQCVLYFFEIVAVHFVTSKYDGKIASFKRYYDSFLNQAVILENVIRNCS